ncbi:transcription factor bHLH30 [Amborella trichopoda]|uniref:BHLH domain-containing protein n=1 Tax=Amborella trichopoda TaxID=13333 RepID=W1NU54_AMBTC|nr:transcription factor bHLH30 [Amborella trichopoda]ERM99122.1 hypothetical protein AMTR_s00101p00150740 [Amborella trichopoda]|eukprot:XP_006836269.1 transcription factor bHLH30 [Amborella trichopoda]
MWTKREVNQESESYGYYWGAHEELEPGPLMADPSSSLGVSANLDAFSSYYCYGGNGFHGVEVGGMREKGAVDAKAMAALRSHSEAEKRRRERINGHFDKLRHLLPSNVKRDKASLLAEAIRRLKELKLQTSEISAMGPIPDESDEVTVECSGEFPSDSGKSSGQPVVMASFSCDDRSDLLPELITTLKSLRLKTIRAEIQTLEGRMRHVLHVTCEDSGQNSLDCGDLTAGMLQEALKQVVHRSPEDRKMFSGGLKRQRTNSGF